MGDYFDQWWYGATNYDMRQEEAMAAMSARHSRAAAELKTTLRAEAKRTGDLAARLGRLEDAVVAMVELEDLRGVMENFSDAASTRRYARDVLARIPALGRVPSRQTPDVPPDVPGYWLHPAVRALDARLHGDAATEAAAAQEARTRDAGRTAQFLAAVGILLDSEVADDDLATLWPSTQQVSKFQRELWLAVARGALGPDARTGLAHALTWVLEQPQSAGAEAQAEPTVRTVAAPSRSTQTVEHMVLDAMLDRRPPSNPAEAAESLEMLRTHVEDALAEREPTVAVESIYGGVADVLAQVVSSGAPDEQPLVARLAEIRSSLAAIGASTSITAPALLDEQSLDVRQLLRGDLAATADPAMRAVAISAARPAIERLADSLAERAMQPVAHLAKLRVSGGVDVVVGPEGATDGDWRRRVAERVTHATPDGPRSLGARRGRCDRDGARRRARHPGLALVAAGGHPGRGPRCLRLPGRAQCAAGGRRAPVSRTRRGGQGGRGAQPRARDRGGAAARTPDHGSRVDRRDRPGARLRPGTGPGLTLWPDFRRSVARRRCRGAWVPGVRFVPWCHETHDDGCRTTRWSPPSRRPAPDEPTLLRVPAGLTGRSHTVPGLAQRVAVH